MAAARRRGRRGRRRPVANPNATSPLPFLGMGLMAASLFLYLYAWVVVPWYGFVLLLAAWVVMFVLCTRWWSRHPARVVVVPVVAIVLWFTVLVGGAALGW